MPDNKAYTWYLPRICRFKAQGCAALATKCLDQVSTLCLFSKILFFDDLLVVEWKYEEE